MENIFNVLLIRETIKQIDTKIKEMGNKNPFEMELEIMTLFPEFYDSHPFLVKKLCKRDDLTMLYKMLSQLEEVETGSRSLSTVELTLGEELAQQYLYPVVGKK